MQVKVFARKFSTSIGKILRSPHVCVVGSGPAGFYTTQQILKTHPSANVDIYEKLPVPFGLVRYGVAPDHPEVKNCINTFTQAAKNDRVSFYGNVSIGTDITLNELREAYDAIVLAYGAAKDRLLNIPGENLKNVLSARCFVGWYNGLPEDAKLPLNLDVEDVVVIGHGNVAIDVARILLTPINVLKKTDIPDPVLEALSKSRVKRVHTVGRRAARHVAFTIKELREMINLEECKSILRRKDFEELPSLIPEMPRPKKRLMELLAKTALNPPPSQIASWEKAKRDWLLHFLLSPNELSSTNSNGSVTGIQFLRTRIEGEKAIPTDEIVHMDCQLVLRSIGYTSIRIDPSIPFDEDKGLIPNINGKVVGHDDLYVSGWLGTGPVGVILTTMQDGFNTGKLVVADLASHATNKSGKEHTTDILSKRGINFVTFKDWNRLDSYEIEEGSRRGKPREKITDLNKMLNLAGKKVS